MTNAQLVEDPLTGEMMTQEEDVYLNDIRDALARGELTGVPQDDGSWDIGIEDFEEMSSEGVNFPWQQAFETEQRPTIPALTQVADARRAFKRMGLPSELFDIPDEIKTIPGGGYYDQNQNAIAMNKTMLGKEQPWTAGHETLHAFEANLTDEELAELKAIISDNPPPAGDPTRHHPPTPGSPDRGTGLPAYFDYVFGSFLPETAEGVTIRGERTPAIPVPIMEFIRRTAPKVAERVRGRRNQTINMPPPISADDLASIELEPLEDEPLSPGGGLAELHRLREEITGESDPAIQASIMGALGSLPLEMRRELLHIYKMGITPTADFIETLDGKGRTTGMGLERQAAWERMLKLAPEILGGNVTQAQWEKIADRATATILDPITAAGKRVLGEETWESLPQPIQTAAEWAPILIAPQKGIIKDFTVGGLGTKAGAVAIGGAVAGEQVAQVIGAPEFPIELIGATVAGGFAGVGRRLAQRTIQPQTREQMMARFEVALAGERGAIDLGKLAGPEGKPIHQILAEIENIKERMKPEIRAQYDRILSLVDTMPDDSFAPIGIAREAETAGNAIVYRRIRNYDEGISVLEAMQRVNDIETTRARGQLELGLDVAPPSLADGFRLPSSIDGHAVSTKARAIGKAVRKDALPIFTSPYPTVANLYAGGADLMLAIEYDPSGLIYESSRVSRTGGAAYSATFADAEQVIDARSVKRVRIVTPQSVERLNEFQAFFESQIRTGGFKGAYVDKDPELVAANLKASVNLEAPIYRLDRIFREAPLRLTNGLSIMEGSRVRLWNGTEAALSPSSMQPFMWAGSVDLDQVADMRARNGGIQLAVKGVKGDIPTPEGWNYWPQNHIRDDMIAAVWDRKARRWVSAAEVEQSSDFIPNVKQVVKNFLKDETGSFNLRPREEPLPEDVAKLIGAEPKAAPSVLAMRQALEAAHANELRGFEVKPIDLPDGWKARYEGSEFVVTDPEGFEVGRFRNPLHAADSLENILKRSQEAADLIKIAASDEPLPLLSEQRPTSISVEEELSRDYARLAQMSDDALRREYSWNRRAASRIQDEIDSAGGSMGMTDREQLLSTIGRAQSYGEELALRTGGKEGMLPKIKRAFDQFLAEEEGAIRINLPTGVDPAQRQVTWRPVPHTVRLLDARPINPHLTAQEKVFNVLKNTLHLGTPADPLGARMVDEYSRIRNGALENQANRAAAIAESIQFRFFKPDADGRLKDIPGAPTMQDMAAKFTNYKPMLRADQIAAMERLRALLEPYTNALTEQGIELKTRADIEPGGFYLPRGHAEEDLLDYRSFGAVPPSRRGVKRSFEREAIFDTMVQGIEGVQVGGKLVQYGYHDFATTMQVYFRDAGQRVLDAHIANILKNSTDAAGVPLGSTPHARLLRQNPKLAARMESLRKQVASLSNSVDLMDKRIHGALQTFIHSPAPDLDELRVALNKLQTKAGRLRVRMSERERQMAFRDLRHEINEEVFRNRGRYKGLTGEQARKEALKDALAKIRIRRGRFKGISFDDGVAQLNQIKATIAGLDTDWQAALDRARRTPSGEMALEVRGFGVGLQGTAFDEGLASTINTYLKRIGPPTGARAEAFLLWEATNTLLRGVRATADISFTAIQGLIGAVHTPNAYRRAQAGAMRALLDPVGGKYVLGRFLDDFDRAAVGNSTPTSFEWAAAGLRMGGIDTEFMIGGKLGHTIGGLPIVRQANRAFGYFGDILRLDGAQSQFDIKRLAGLMPAQRQAAMKEISMAMNLMTGWSPGRFLGDTGNLLLFAPRFFQSQLELVVRAFPGLPGGGQNLTRDQARRMLIKLVGIGGMMTIAANEAFGNDDFDYLSPIVNGRFNPNFMRIRAADQDISLFGPWDSLLRAITTAVAEGDPFYLARSKASPTIGMAWDLISGENFLGQRAPKIANLAKDMIGEARAFATGTDYEPQGDWSLVPEYFLRGIAPFSISDIGQRPPVTTLVGVTGAKATPLSTGEKRDILINRTKGELVDSGAVPADMADTFKRIPYHEMPSPMRKLIDRHIRENFPADEADYREARRQQGNIYQTVADIADFERDRYKGDFDKLLAMLMDGEAPDVIWEGVDDSRNKLAGALTAVYEGKSKEAQEFQKAIVGLRPSDLRMVEAAYNGIVAKNQRGPNIFDWDKIEADRIQFLIGLQGANPEVARQFVWALQLKEQLDLEDAHPLFQLKKLVNQQLQPYYQLLDEEAEPFEKNAWLNDNPDADFGLWMTATWENPTIHSVSAAERALKIPNRTVHLAGTTLDIDERNLPILQKYDKEITRLITLPGSLTDKAGRKYSPRTRLRETDALYDALYFWLGMSDEGVVYHIGFVGRFIQENGPRSDGVKPRLPR